MQVAMDLVIAAAQRKDKNAAPSASAARNCSATLLSRAKAAASTSADAAACPCPLRPNDLLPSWVGSCTNRHPVTPRAITQGHQ